jgi:hypothetical protein
VSSKRVYSHPVELIGAEQSDFKSLIMTGYKSDVRARSELSIFLISSILSNYKLEDQIRRDYLSGAGPV